MRDMEQFHMVSFFPRDFVESFAYTALEISLIFQKKSIRSVNQTHLAYNQKRDLNRSLFL